VDGDAAVFQSGCIDDQDTEKTDPVKKITYFPFNADFCIISVAGISMATLGQRPGSTTIG
jgi:hypothetical protein